MSDTKVTKINGVFEGGGVKGSALVGAVAVTEANGYAFDHVAGTSAGAIVASLIAAGYTSSEIETEINNVDYANFKDLNIWGRIPFIGTALNLIIKKGIYEGQFFEDWLAELLLRKGIRTFNDFVMPEYEDDQQSKFRLQVIASDITSGRLLVLPNDAGSYGIMPEDLNVAKAVRMSMSIPYFYKPVLIRDNKTINYIVDGGVLSNFPVWLFDKTNEIPTVGYKLVEPDENKPHKIYGPITLFAALFATMIEAHDRRYIEDSDFERTVPIPTLGIQTTQFDLTLQQKESLYRSGVNAAEKFFQEANTELRKGKVLINIGQD